MNDCIFQAKPKDCLDLSALLNDDLAKTVKKHPSRFVGLGTVPMHKPTLAIQEMKRCVQELGKITRTITITAGKNIKPCKLSYATGLKINF